ncbi:MAG: hypothetical protein PHS40_10080 [Mariniphaga sp.]|nr:hypothetical protein [Mariniphaga sp.]
MKQNYTQREFIRNNSLVGIGAIFCLGAVKKFFLQVTLPVHRVQQCREVNLL